MTDVKVTTDEQPKNQITVKDILGREITVKRPTLLQRANFLLALGDAADNKAYMQQFGFINWVSAIGGEKVFQPTTKLEVDALIGQLEQEGYDAALEAFIQLVNEHFKDDDTALADVKK